jgi:hypothetical protein
MNWPDRAGLDRAGGMLERWRQKREKTSDFKLQLLLQGLAENKAAEELKKSRAYDLTTYEAQQAAQLAASELLNTQRTGANRIEYDRRIKEESDERGRIKEEGDAAELLAREKQAWQSGVTQMSDDEYAVARKLGFPGRGWDNQVANIGPVMDQVRKNYQREELAAGHERGQRAHELKMRAADLEQNELARRSAVEQMEEHYKKLGYSPAEARDKTFKHFEELDLSDYERDLKRLMETGNYTRPQAEEYIARQLKAADIRNKQDVISQVLGMKLSPTEFPGLATPGSPDLYRAYNKYVPMLPGTNIPALTQEKLEARTTPENFPREDALKTEFKVTNVFQLFDDQRMRNLDPDKDHVAARAEVIRTVLADEFNVFSQGISQMQLVVLAGLSESNDPMETPMRYTLGTLSALNSDLNEKYRLFSWIVNARLYPKGKGQAAPAASLEDILK